MKENICLVVFNDVIQFNVMTIVLKELELNKILIHLSRYHQLSYVLINSNAN